MFNFIGLERQLVTNINDWDPFFSVGQDFDATVKLNLCQKGYVHELKKYFF